MHKFFNILPILLLILTTLQSTHQLFTSKVQYSFNKVPAIIEQVFWCGSDGRNVILLTQQKHVYKSEDQGNTWKPIHPKLYEHGKRTAARDEEIGEVQWIKASTTDPNIIMFFGSQGVVWVSQDCGHTIKALYQGRRIESFQFHPTQPRWGLASSINQCEETAEHHPNYRQSSEHYLESSPIDHEQFTRKKNCDIKRQLFYTTDLGDTWKLIAEYVEQFEWAAVDSQHIKHGIPKSRILVVIDLNAHGDQHFGVDFQRNLNLMQSDDFFETSPVKLVKHGNKFSKSKDFLYVACANRVDQEISLFVSHRRTKFQDFKRVKLPLEHLTEHSYTIIDTSQKAAIIHVDHIGGDSKFGHLYISDASGASFSLSLQNNAREPSGICDIDRIWGLQGIYFANAVDIEQDQYFQQVSLKKGSMSQSSMYQSKPMYGYSNASNFARDQAISSSKRRMHDWYSQNQDSRLQHMKKTYATFNKGGKWDLVTPPEIDSKGKAIKCKSSLGCSLHFHAVSTQSVIAPLYSYQSSPGLIISNGNIGPFLQMNPGVINTYLSRDGGKEWIEIAKGAHVYEFGNYGALIVMAPDMTPTKHIMYSWDEGLTWDYQVVSMQDIIVQNIMIEPSASSQKFVVFGLIADESQEGVIVHLDFTSMHQAACKGMFQGMHSQTDFEQWSPYDGRSGQKCLLGRHFTYTRRKRNSKCYIEGNLPSPRLMSCECTDYDYECDEGYGRETVNSPCKLQQNLVQFKTQFLKDKDNQSYSLEAVKKRQCEQGSHYFVSQGYRKVAGNSCYGGLDRNPKMHSCSRFSSGFSGTVVFVLLMIVLLFVLFVYCGPPTAIIEFFRDKGSKYWERAKQIIGGNDANKSDNLGQYDRVGFAAVPDHYEPEDDFDDDDDDDDFVKGSKDDKRKEKAAAANNKSNTAEQNQKEGNNEVAKDLLADQDGEDTPLEL